MQSIIKQYPEAKEALSEYVAGIINEQELFAQLENVYNDDKTQYVNAVLKKCRLMKNFSHLSKLVIQKYWLKYRIL